MGYAGIDKSNPSGDGRAAVDRVYHDLRKTSPEAARLLVRRVLEQQGGNVSKTARILGISRKTVRRAREGPLEDLSRRPKSSPKRLRADFEQLILTEAKRTGYGPMRLSKLLWREYTRLEFDEMVLPTTAWVLSLR